MRTSSPLFAGRMWERARMSSYPRAARGCGRALPTVSRMTFSSTASQTHPLGSGFRFLVSLRMAGSSSFDLGASFPVERIAFFPNPADSTAFLRAYEIKVSDGRSFGTDERPIYETLARVEVSTEVRTEAEFPRQLVRYIRLETLEPNPFGHRRD